MTRPDWLFWIASGAFDPSVSTTTTTAPTADPNPFASSNFATTYDSRKMYDMKRIPLSMPIT